MFAPWLGASIKQTISAGSASRSSFINSFPRKAHRVGLKCTTARQPYSVSCTPLRLQWTNRTLTRIAARPPMRLVFTKVQPPPKVVLPPTRVSSAEGALRELQRIRCRVRSYTHGRGYTPEFRLGGDEVVLLTVGTNVVVYGMWWWALRDSRKAIDFMMDNFTVSGVGVIDIGRWHTLLTSMFSHQELWHLATNMFTLYFFGSGAAMILGIRRFLTLYLTGGLASSLGCVAWPYVAHKMKVPAALQTSKWTPSLGASGAINALVSFTIMVSPFTAFYIYGIIPFPALLAGVGYLAYDLRGLYYGGTGTAHAGHLGGTAIGVLYFLRMRFLRFR